MHTYSFTHFIACIFSSLDELMQTFFAKCSICLLVVGECGIWCVACLRYETFASNNLPTGALYMVAIRFYQANEVFNI